MIIKILLALIFTTSQAQAFLFFKTKLSNGQTLAANTIGYTFNRNGHTLSTTNGQVSIGFNTNGSFAFSNNKLQLTNDVTSPGNTYYYGTNGSGTKGYYTLSAGSGTVTNVSNGDRFLAVANQTTTPSITTLAQGSAAWATKFTDEVGTGRIVFNGSTTLASPTLVTPAIGAATGTSLVASGRLIAGTNVNGTTANFTKVLSSGVVNGTTANLTKVLATGSVNGATLNATTGNITNIATTKMIATGSVNGATVNATNISVANGMYQTAWKNLGNGGSTEAIDFSKSTKIALVLNANCAISAVDPGGATAFHLMLSQHTVGSKTVTWTACGSANGFCWPGGTAPTLTTTAAAIDFISCAYHPSKDRYYCQSGLDFK